LLYIHKSKLNLMKKIILLCLILTGSLISFAQSNSSFEISGKIMDKGNQSTLPFVNIGIIGKYLGTVSDENGDFTLSINEKFALDTIKISMIGYESASFTVQEFINLAGSKLEVTIELTEKVEMLSDVIIWSKPLKSRNIGNKGKSTIAGFTPFKANALGNEVGVFCFIRENEKVHLESFHAFVYLNDYDSIFFRLNFYAIGQDDKPANTLLQKPIYVNFNGEKGLIELDLKAYNLSFSESFVVALENVKDWDRVITTKYRDEKNSGLYLGANFFGEKTMIRKTSQANWEVPNQKSISAQMGVKVKYEKTK
jgi:hypothetical protein